MPEARHRAQRTGRRRPAWVAAAGAALLVTGAATSLPALDQGAAHLRGSTGAREASTVSATVLRHSAPGDPREVRIPSLGVASRVLPLHTDHRTLVPPGDPQVLGWWAEGARPGDERGSVLIAGHTVHTGGGALDHLERLQAGDRVDVLTRAATVRYTVQRVRIDDKTWLAQHAGATFSQRGPARLVLVTCADWDGEHYLSNVVVTATRTS